MLVTVILSNFVNLKLFSQVNQQKLKKNLAICFNSGILIDFGSYYVINYQPKESNFPTTPKHLHLNYRYHSYFQVQALNTYSRNASSSQKQNIRLTLSVICRFNIVSQYLQHHLPAEIPDFFFSQAKLLLAPIQQYQIRRLQMIRGTTKLIHKFSGVISEPFSQFLENQQPSLEMKKTSTRSFQGNEIYVSKAPISREKAIQFMTEKTIQNKTVLINIDPTHLVGMKRLFAKNYLKKEVYKGIGQPVDILTKQNPIRFLKVQEMRFDQGIFGSTDPMYMQMKERGVVDKQAMALLSQFYNNNPERGGERLLKQYSVPPEYIPIVQAAHNLGNNIYFVGLNEYDIRELLAAFMKLNQVKIFFMQCLNYSLATEISQQELKTKFHFKCKEYLWLRNYNFLQPINYQQIRSFKKKLKGYYFAHSYNFLVPQNQTIDFRRLKDTQSDTMKLEKQAILSVLFGNIWNRPYTNNPFVYLAQNFLNLSYDDKQTVVQIYNKNFHKYETAKDKFFEQKFQQKSPF